MTAEATHQYGTAQGVIARDLLREWQADTSTARAHGVPEPRTKVYSGWRPSIPVEPPRGDSISTMLSNCREFLAAQHEVQLIGTSVFPPAIAAPLLLHCPEPIATMRVPAIYDSCLAFDLWGQTANRVDADDEAYLRLQSLLERPENWDGYGGRPPTVEAIAQARELIGRIAGTPTPEIDAAGDGEINLVWRSQSDYLEIGLYGDGGFSYFAKMNGVPVLANDVELIPNQLPVELTQFLLRFRDGKLRVRGFYPERT